MNLIHPLKIIKIELTVLLSLKNQLEVFAEPLPKVLAFKKMFTIHLS